MTLGIDIEAVAAMHMKTLDLTQQSCNIFQFAHYEKLPNPQTIPQILVMLETDTHLFVNHILEDITASNVVKHPRKTDSSHL